MEQSPARPPLRRTGDLAAAREQIGFRGIFKTAGGNFRRGGLHEARLDARRAQRPGDALVDLPIRFPRRPPREAMRLRHDQRVGHILAMHDHAAAGPSAHHFPSPPRRTQRGDLLEIAKRNRRLRPPINPQQRPRRPAQEHFVDRHVQRGAVRLGVEHFGHFFEEHRGTVASARGPAIFGVGLCAADCLGFAPLWQKSHSAKVSAR